MRKVLSMGLALLIAGCVPSDQLTAGDKVTPPTKHEQLQMLVETYSVYFGEPIEDPQVGAIKTAKLLPPTLDYYYCAKFSFYEIGTVYAANGRVLRSPGDKYLEHGLVLTRFSDGRWKPVIFKPFRTSTIEGKPVSDYCPSE